MDHLAVGRLGGHKTAIEVSSFRLFVLAFPIFADLSQIRNAAWMQKPCTNRYINNIISTNLKTKCNFVKEGDESTNFTRIKYHLMFCYWTPRFFASQSWEHPIKFFLLLVPYLGQVPNLSGHNLIWAISRRVQIAGRSQT